MGSGLACTHERRGEPKLPGFYFPPQVPSPGSQKRNKAEQAGQRGPHSPLEEGADQQAGLHLVLSAHNPLGVVSGVHLDPLKKDSTHTFIIRNFQFILNKLLNLEQTTLPQIFL